MSVSLRPRPPSFAELYTPKLLTVWREGYGAGDLRRDAIAGLTVAIVALPLSMAIAIASGLPPSAGLFTAIIGGFLISLLGGSRFQIGGPAGAFIVLTFSIVERHGHDGLLIATAMAGLMMIAIGLARIGTYVRYIPLPVTVGFTAGIALIIFASQVRELLGLDLPAEPAALLPKLAALWEALPTARWQAIALAAFSVAMILALRRWRPAWPGLLITVAAASLIAALPGVEVATVGGRFGEMPHGLPAPRLPGITPERLLALLPDAAAIALLGAIESLLSAMVADGMSGRRHRSNCELVAQGLGNLGAAFFAGMPVTGTIARTATNVRAGARGPVAGMLHAGFLLLFLAAAAPLAAFIPLAALAAVLAIVAWNMAERHEFRALLSASRGDALVLLTTFFLTVLVDLTAGIAAGVVLGAFLFLHRMAEALDVEGGDGLALADRADSEGGRGRYEPAAPGEPLVYRVRGALFFGATAVLGQILDRIGPPPAGFVLDLSEVPLVDTTAAKSLARFAERLQAAGTPFWIAGARPAVRRSLLQAGLRQPLVRYASDPADLPDLEAAAPSPR